MLWFNFMGFVVGSLFNRISIHLMLWFNTSVFPVFGALGGFQYILCYGSTGYMCCPHDMTPKFQYILCYGSTLRHSAFRSVLQYFNTSYVMVQQENFDQLINFYVFQYILCYGSTQSNGGDYLVLSRFQYILCYGSTE